jgi:hypothetical protein
MSVYQSVDRGEPHDPAREGQPGPSIPWEADPPACGPDPAAGSYPPQGEHHAAGGLPQHHLADGGLGGGHQAPPGWPDYGLPGR